jgi:tagaturonate reductase
VTITPILQFGTSRFLQAHVDLFVHEAAESGQPVGPITVVASSGSMQGRARLKALADPDGYPVLVRGMQGGQPAEWETRVRSIRRSLDAEADWGELKRVFIDEARFVISNTTENGFAVPGDYVIDLRRPAETVPSTYPAKLLALLAARQQADAGPLIVLPTELITRNGDELRRILLDLARRSGAPDTLVGYIEHECTFANSLVDRIVSAALEPAGAVAEPYALWAVEHRPGLVMPCAHVAIDVVDDLEPIQRLKLHILNLGHTVLAELWSSHALESKLTVREMVGHPELGKVLRDIYENEVLPGFCARGMGDRAEVYIATTLDRFANPFLDHRLSDIAVNHREKVSKRISAFMSWTGLPLPSAMPRLSDLCRRNGIS